MEPAVPIEKFEALLQYLQNGNGFDFTGYKRSSLIRRVRWRMGEVRIHDFGDYLEYLKAHPAEFTLLFNCILINVTEFFRDPAAWKFLAAKIVPRLLRDKHDAEPIRIWSVGCASGEEVYTLSMVFAEAMGTDAWRLSRCHSRSRAPASPRTRSKCLRECKVAQKWPRQLFRGQLRREF
jgi:two-component system CheB/CheR fusion protein